jgi:spermidine synthase
MVKYRPQVEGIVLHEEESFYHHIEVSERGESPYKQRLLRLDSTNEGGMNPDDGSLVFPYQQFWQVVKFKEDFKIQNALFMGAGAFGMPEILSRQYPQASIDVAEIDPKVIDAGHRYFKLGEFPHVHAHAEDARHFLRSRPGQRWDLIFGDAYNGVRAIPSHLLTQEFFQLVSDRLTPDGVFVMNVITALRGPQSELLAGILKTLRTVYPHVEVFDVEGLNGRPNSGHQAQNVILLASRQDWRPYFKERFFASGSMEKRIAETLVAPQELPQSGILFTDNYNPVDAIIARGLIQ